jgi:hypothetical protein
MAQVKRLKQPSSQHIAFKVTARGFECDESETAFNRLWEESVKRPVLQGRKGAQFQSEHHDFLVGANGFTPRRLGGLIV